MLSPEYIAQIKQISLPQYLASQGFQPVSQHGSQLLYYSPFRNESTPSFYVNVVNNVFKDFGDNDLKGDIIRLIQLLNKHTFSEAVQELERFSNQVAEIDFSFSGLKSKSSTYEVIKAVKLLSNRALITYVENRGIQHQTALRYLREIHYTHQKKSWFAVGLENDKGGYELRTRIASVEVKRCIGTKAMTTIQGSYSQSINLFEGCFDFLSALEFFQQPKPNHSTVILNSTALLEQALPILRQYAVVNAYLDNDESGRKTLFQLQKAGLLVKDYSYIYRGYKDLNEYWQERAINCLQVSPPTKLAKSP